jgi:hypothetical protein
MIATDRILERRQIENDSVGVVAVVSDADSSSAVVELKNRTAVLRAPMLLLFLGALILPFSKDDTEVTTPRNEADKFVAASRIDIILCRRCPIESLPMMMVLLRDARSRALPGAVFVVVSNIRNMFVN